LNKERNDKVYHPIRDQYGALKGKRRELTKAIEKSDPDLEAKKAEFEKWQATMKQTVTDLLAKAKALEDQIYSENQPKPHQYEISLAL